MIDCLRAPCVAAGLPLGLWLLVLFACSTPTQPTTAPRPEGTVSALQTQVSVLSAQLRPSPTIEALPTSTAQPPAEPVATVVEVVLEEIVVEAAAAEREPEPTSAPTPSPTRRPTAFPTRTPRPLTAEDAAPCEIGQIKGNRDSRIYHVPTGASYARTKNKVDCFPSEAEAQAAGYRRARN